MMMYYLVLDGMTIGCEDNLRDARYSACEYLYDLDEDGASLKIYWGDDELIETITYRTYAGIEIIKGGFQNERLTGRSNSDKDA